jgi:hypothetical protein
MSELRDRHRRGSRLPALNAAALVAILALATSCMPASAGAPAAGERGVALGGVPFESVSAPGSLWMSICVRDCPRPQFTGQLVEVDSRTGAIVKRLDGGISERSRSPTARCGSPSS